MKGVILAGGTGSRLSPLTKVTNKHLLPVYDEPMIFKVIKTLTKSGIRDITIVLGGESVGDFVRLLGDGRELGARITYVYQRGSGGIAEALYLTRHIVEGYKTAVLLGDNIFEDTFTKDVLDWESREDKCGCKIFLKVVDDPERFGVAEFYKGKITSLVEKPIFPKSKYAVTGLYFYDVDLFTYIDYQIENIGYSTRRELEVTDLNKLYLENNLIDYQIVEGFWSDAGTFETLLKSSNFIKGKSDRK